MTTMAFASSVGLRPPWLLMKTLPTVVCYNIGALIITDTILGVPYYNYSIVGPKTLF